VTDQQILERIRKNCQQSLHYLAHQVLSFKDVNGYTHGEMIECLESDINRKLLCVPRGCLKSSLACVAYPIWRLICDPNLRILIDSELYTNSSTFLREIRSHLESRLMTLLFGDFKGSTWNDSELIIKQRTVFKKEASITVGGIGTTKVGQHYDLIIGDDYNSPRNSNTPDNAAKVISHYRYNISILEPTGTYVLIGTRYSEADLIGAILRDELGLNEGTPKSGIYEVRDSA